MVYTDFQAASGTVLAQLTLMASVPTAESTSTKVCVAATGVDLDESDGILYLTPLSRPRRRWSPLSLLNISKIGEQ